MHRKRMETWLTILFWLISSWLIISLFSIATIDIEIENGKEVKHIIRNSSLMGYLSVGQLFFAAYFYSQLYIIQMYSQDRAAKKLLLLSILAIFFTIGLYYLMIKFLPLGNGMLLSISLIVFLFYITTAVGYGFIKVWIQTEQDKKQLELVKNKAELNLMRSQLQPHFLFNTMNNLLAMVNQKENPALAKSIHTLSGLLRYIVYETQKDKVSISDEIDFIQSFADLHLLRFEEGEVDFSLNIIGNNSNQVIEPGILLCFVENAFKHGVQPETQTFVHVHIDLSVENVIYFTIENAILAKLNNATSGGYGLQSTTERLALVYPSQYTLTISTNETFKVQLKINTK